jgi:hypothetical protein
MGLVSLNVDADLDPLRDKRARRRIHDFLDELPDPVEHRPRVVRMNRREAAGILVAHEN